ncbi:MAG: CBS domain-containing protein [Cyanobacteria bacterium J069]
MHLILCHTTADFDTLGAAVGLSRLRAGARIVLTGGSHPAVKEFLALHRDEYALIERRAVNPENIRTIAIVDTQWRDRLGKAAEWLDLPVDIIVYDHHPEGGGDIPTKTQQVEAVGATTTLIVEALQQQQIVLTPAEATVMALGIHVDTGSLTYDHTTVRDAAALTWLMQQGASVQAIAAYVEPGLSPQLQDLLAIALDNLQTETVQGYAIAWVLLPVAEYIPGLSSLASHLTTLTESDVLLLAAHYVRAAAGESTEPPGEARLTVIGRSRSALADLSALFKPLGGGGHPTAAAVTLRTADPQVALADLVGRLRTSIPAPPTARSLMSSPVRTIRPDTTIAEAQRILLRYGHSGLSVVDEQDRLVGIISRRDLDIAFHHGFGHAPVKGYMTTNVKTIAPSTPLPDIESLMVTYDIGRLPVLEGGRLVGIVTRTDVLRQVWQQRESEALNGATGRGGLCPLPDTVWEMLGDRLVPALWDILRDTADLAAARGWQLYMVGGSVRDLMLQTDGPLLLPDIDLVVDGFHQAADQAAGVELARSLQEQHPQSRLQVHGKFQTAALTWHHHPQLDSLWIDIATARTEFYPYPAANPEVEASSIRQDLYRRDFTINAMAIRLTQPRRGELLDFFGGILDLRDRQIRVLHANSFIEDPTRIYRAVRFAVRLGFTIDPQTEAQIRHAIASGVYFRIQAAMETVPALQTRLRRELKYILEAPYWKTAILKLADLDALRCLHPDLTLDTELWRQLRLGDRWLTRFDADHRLEHWLLLLEVAIAHLPADRSENSQKPAASNDPSSVRARIATGLQLPAESIQRLANLHAIEAALADLDQFIHQSTAPFRPSQIVRYFADYDLPTLALLTVRSPRRRRLIWHYLTVWSQVKSPLDGNDLKRLGYKPGKQFKPMLDRLLAATLDGELNGDLETLRQQAEQLLAQQFSQL